MSEDLMFGFMVLVLFILIAMAFKFLAHKTQTVTI